MTGRFPTPGRLAAVWVAFLVVAAFGLMSCTREVSGSPVKSNPMLSVDLGTVLLDAHEIDDVMGTSGSEVLDEGNAPDDATDVDPPECHGLVYIAGKIEYASTNFTAMRWRIVGAKNEGGADVVYMVAQLPSVAKADEFIDKQTKAWEGCADEVITTKDKGSTSTTQDRVTAVRARPHIVIASTDALSSEMPCHHGQHVLQAVSNFVLDVSVCGNNVSDQAEVIASKLADRVQHG
ncbi:MAG TPA: sensor domain-containing protein [Mycobacterium sp.]|nr:sensor domain-containing protein [Mycobacterium sp.]